MQTRLLPGRYQSVPVIGLGAFAAFNAKSANACRSRWEQIDSFQSRGGRLIDTGSNYGAAPEVVSSFVKDNRDDYLISYHLQAKTRAQGDTLLSRAIELFDVLDTVLIHNQLAIEAHIDGLKIAKARGDIAAIGVSQYLPKSFEKLLPLIRHREIDLVQVPYNPLERTVERQVIPEAEDKKVAVCAVLSPKFDPVFRGLPPETALSGLEQSGINTWFQAVVQWVVSNPSISYVVIDSDDPNLLEEACAVARYPSLDGDMRTYIRLMAEKYAP